MMKINYCLEFSELSDEISSSSPEELELITVKMKEHLSKYLMLSGLKLDGDIKLTFDLVEVES